MEILYLEWSLIQKKHLIQLILLKKYTIMEFVGMYLTGLKVI